MIMKILKGILIDTETNSGKVIETYNTPNKYTNLLKCTSFEIMTVVLDNKTFALVFDEEGFNKPNYQTSVVTEEYNQVLVGNVLVFGIDDKDELVGLDERDVDILFNRIKMSGQDLHPILMI